VATVAVNVWPAVLTLEPTVCPRRTVTTVPAGITKARAASGFIDMVDFDMEAPGAPGLAAELLLLLLLLSVEDGEELESGGAAGLLQPSTAKHK
jgi:hypothetical protein